jgi:hypothetical protein
MELDPPLHVFSADVSILNAMLISLSAHDVSPMARSVTMSNPEEAAGESGSQWTLETFGAPSRILPTS